MDDPNSSQSTTSIRLPYPKGLLRLAMRLPILLYRLRLGWLLGDRFLLLEHVGRKSGAVRRAVVEVVDHDVKNDAYVVAAAWGTKSNWYNNVLAHPRVTILVRSKRFEAQAKTLSREDAVHHLHAYSVKHASAFRQIGSLLIGQQSREPSEIIQSFVDAVPLVEFSPVHSEAEGK
jgi:deazaflavin-dependent oxidoreductase (nitroreductase family)